MDYLTGAGLVLTATTVLWGVYVYRRQMNAQLFVEYTRRYDEIMMAFPGSTWSYRLGSSDEAPPRSPELSVSILKYLNLCSEEFYLWRRGYLSGDLWRVWETEIVRTVSSPLFVREWKEISLEFVSYPEFRGWIKKAQAERSGVGRSQ